MRIEPGLTGYMTERGMRWHVIRTMRLPVLVDPSWFFTAPIPDDDMVAEVSALQRNNERYLERREHSRDR